MILPSGATDDVAEDLIEQPSRTYKLGSGNESLEMIDGIEAVKQTVTHILSTPRGEYPIYSYDYGFDSSTINVNDKATFQAEVIRRIQEALLQDDRIITVDNFLVTYSNDESLIEFTVTSTFGQFSTEKTVRQSV